MLCTGGCAQAAVHRGLCTGGCAQGAVHRGLCTGGCRILPRFGRILLPFCRILPPFCLYAGPDECLPLFSKINKQRTTKNNYVADDDDGDADNDAYVRGDGGDDGDKCFVLS